MAVWEEGHGQRHWREPAAGHCRGACSFLYPRFLTRMTNPPLGSQQGTRQGTPTRSRRRLLECLHPPRFPALVAERVSGCGTNQPAPLCVRPPFSPKRAQLKTQCFAQRHQHSTCWKMNGSVGIVSTFSASQQQLMSGIRNGRKHNQPANQLGNFERKPAAPLLIRWEEEKKPAFRSH